MLNMSDAEENWESQGGSNPHGPLQHRRGRRLRRQDRGGGSGGRRFPEQGEPRPHHGRREVHQGVHQRRPGGQRARTPTWAAPTRCSSGCPATTRAAPRPRCVGPIRVAAGGKKLYDALAEKGRVATQGIYFDTGSDAIRQESAPTLKEIGTMLKDHADLKLTIEGHTDNVGKAESNQALSEKRAAAVRQYLIDNYQIDARPAGGEGAGSDQAGRRPTTRPKAGSRTGGWSWSRSRPAHMPAPFRRAPASSSSCFRSASAFGFSASTTSSGTVSLQLLELRRVHAAHLVALLDGEQRGVDPAQVRRQVGERGRQVAPHHRCSAPRPCPPPGRRPAWSSSPARPSAPTACPLRSWHSSASPRIPDRRQLGGHALSPAVDVRHGDRRCRLVVGPTRAGRRIRRRLGRGLGIGRPPPRRRPRRRRSRTGERQVGGGNRESCQSWGSLLR